MKSNRGKSESGSISNFLTGFLLVLSFLIYVWFFLQDLLSGEWIWVELVGKGFLAVISLVLALAKSRGSVNLLGLVWILVGLMLMSLAGLIAVKWSIPKTMKVHQTTKWRKTACTITSSHIQVLKQADGRRKMPVVRYSYQINGRSYDADVVDVFWSDVDSSQGAEALVERYPAGLNTVCFVNPENPQEAALQKGFSQMHLIAFLPLVIFLPGLAILIAIIRQGRKQRMQSIENH